MRFSSPKSQNSVDESAEEMSGIREIVGLT